MVHQSPVPDPTHVERVHRAGADGRASASETFGNRREVGGGSAPGSVSGTGAASGRWPPACRSSACWRSRRSGLPCFRLGSPYRAAGSRRSGKGRPPCGAGSRAAEGKAMPELTRVLVGERALRRVWNTLVAPEQRQGVAPFAGEQMRYLIGSAEGCFGALRTGLLWPCSCRRASAGWAGATRSGGRIST